MLNILKVIFISLIIIFILHYLWNYIKDNYSTKKTKDLVGFQTEKYKNILNEIIENNKSNNKNDFISEDEKRFLYDDLSELVNGL
jgi:hypothetical protein